MSLFKLHAPFQPTGDQPNAIEQLANRRPEISTLLGVTGSGKTFTIAQVIARQHKQVLILSPNKTLAAQLYEEFSLFFPENKVCYFVSYYDYYQPESYLPAHDMYIPKETKINDELDRLRIEATASLINRPDTIIISSVSCIYSLGNPQDYKNLALRLHVGQRLEKYNLIKALLEIQYQRNDTERAAGTFQVFTDTVIIQIPYQRENASIVIFNGIIEEISWISRGNNELLGKPDNILIFPAKHFATTTEKKEAAKIRILQELELWLPKLQNSLYQDRLYNRVKRDIELIEQTGTCPGIENYSAHIEGRLSGTAPHTLFDFFENPLIIIDESHLALPQLRGMYAGDQSRKQSLVDFGFRLPSAKDNRPLKFEEIEKFFKDVIFVSATPGEYELSHSTTIVEQMIRPTGIIDPSITIAPREKQLDRLIKEIEDTSSHNNRTMITVLTKKLAEELALYLEKKGLKVCYLHHDLKTPQRTEVIHKFRSGIFECLIGINLLREGLDMPEVELVAIFDADLESFLRDKRSLIQTIGRAARNSQGRVIMFADTITKSMEEAISETNRRRAIQVSYNEKHNITPTSTKRSFGKTIVKDLHKKIKPPNETREKKDSRSQENIEILKREMMQAAENLNFEKAIELRNKILLIQKDIMIDK